MDRRATVLAVALLTTAPFGCSPEQPKASFSQRDSAGVTIAESAAPRWTRTEGWRVDPVPLLDLTNLGTGESHEFYQVRDAARLPDGTIAVAESTSDEVRLFSASGEFLGALGGSGDGPGEFRFPGSIDAFHTDSIAVFDRQLQRITVLSIRGDGYRVIPLQIAGKYVMQLRPLDDTTFVARLSSPWAPEERDGLYRNPENLVRVHATGEILDTMTVLAGSESFQSMGGGVSSAPLFGKSSYFAVSGGRVYFGDADRMELSALSASGQIEQVIRVPGFDLSLAPREVAEEREARIGPNSSARSREILAAMPDPRTRPAYCGLLVDTEGCVWAEECQGLIARMRNGRPWRWTVFSPEGEWLGSVEFPTRFFVLRVGSDYVLGNRYDENDVEHVEMLRLVRD